MSRLVKTVLAAVVLYGLIGVTPAFGAGTVTFRNGENGYTDMLDTFVRQDVLERKEWNNGGSGVVQVQSSGNPVAAKLGLIKFQNISGNGANQIPLSESVISATLRLNILLELIETGAQKDLFFSPMLIDVPNYGTGDGPGLVGEVTWAFREQALDDWGLPDGDETDDREGPVDGEDFDSASVAHPTLNHSYTATAPYGIWLDIDLTPHVQAWHDGALSNFGWLIQPDTGGFASPYFNSSEATDVSLRPQLVVEFGLAGLLLGDADNSLTVTADDLIAVQQNFGNVGPVGDGTDIGDADDSGTVTADDLISVQQNFGCTPTTSGCTLDGVVILGPAGGGVPEPATGAVVLAGALAACRRRRR